MDESKSVINLNFPPQSSDEPHRNYQLIKTDIIELESNIHISSYSIMVNSISHSKVIFSEFLCDVSRDEKQAKMIFELISQNRVSQEMLFQTVEDILG